MVRKIRERDKTVIVSVLVVLAIAVSLLGSQIFFAPGNQYRFVAKLDSNPSEIEESDILNIGESEELQCNPDIINPSTCDYRFSLQNEFLPDDIYNEIDHLGIANTGWTISGSAVLAGVGQTEQEMIDATKEEIRTAFLNYLNNPNNELDASTTEFVDLNIEFPVQPYNLWMFDENTVPKQSELIEAWRLRIEVVREELPNAKLAFFQIPRGGAGTGAKTETGDLRMEAYITAGELGLYDDLDYLSPPFYLFFPPSDVEHGTIEQFVRDMMERAETLVGMFGQGSLKVAPFLHILYLQEDSETGERVFITPEDQSLTNSILQEYESVKIVNYWSQDEFYSNYPDYFSEAAIVPCECFN